jgi:exosortase C (VPDSG-CTERM-specific)
MNLETTESSTVPLGAAPPGAVLTGERFVPSWRRFKGLAIFTGLVVLAFAKPLFVVLTFAPHAELYSHILLIPFISGYLIWMKRGEVVLESEPNRRMALLPLAAGALLLAGYWMALRRGWTFAKPDYLAVTMLAFVLFLMVGGFLFIGAKYFKSIAFPAVFLFFCVPFPQFVRDGIETFFQRGSAETAYLMLRASGMSVLKTGTHFQMPAFSLDVAPQCSGIHSSLVLLITSLLAAHMFLQTPSRKVLFTLSVIPLALLRNGFRIFTISELCVHVGPQMIDSPIHHHGGPLFFLLSLVPLFLLLVYLTKSEARKEHAMAVRRKN